MANAHERPATGTHGTAIAHGLATQALATTNAHERPAIETHGTAIACGLATLALATAIERTRPVHATAKAHMRRAGEATAREYARPVK